MPISLPLAAVGAAALYLLWNVFRQYFKSYQYDNLPGPSGGSTLLGSLHSLTQSRIILTKLTIGHIARFRHRQSWRLWAEYAELYGPTFVIRATLAVGLRVILIFEVEADFGSV